LNRRELGLGLINVDYGKEEFGEGYIDINVPSFPLEVYKLPR